MNKVFTIHRGFQVPDGTIASPFLDFQDSESDLPWDLVEGFSISAGELLQTANRKST